MPGEDSPVEKTREGNTEKLDFGEGENMDEIDLDNATIIHPDNN